MALVSVTIRVNESTKLAASSFAEDFGFNLSSVTRAFYKQNMCEQRYSARKNPQVRAWLALCENTNSQTTWGFKCRLIPAAEGYARVYLRALASPTALMSPFASSELRTLIVFVFSNPVI